MTRIGPSRLVAITICVAAVGCAAHQPTVEGGPANEGSEPLLPATLYAYSDSSAPLPAHFLFPGPPGRLGGPGGPPPFGPPGGRGGPPGRGGPGGPGGPVLATDRTPLSNPTTDAGATLGRVLFYDRRLSANNTTACASCHQQQFGFGDTARFSVGFDGQRATRHTMALANARFYREGRYFWDERAVSLEDQALQPIQNEREMGLSLDALESKLRRTAYYPALFKAAFGSADVSRERVARALAQFVRSLVSAQSPFDAAFARVGPGVGRGPGGRGRGGPPPDFQVLTPEQRIGQRLFVGRAGCAQCHGTNALVLDAPHNTGLDATITDQGAGGGRFKAPSLRNVAVRAPYMHDGRFATLREVVDFYDHGVQPNRNLDRRLRDGSDAPRKLNLSENERVALVAYLESLTDTTFLTARKFSNPFLPATSGR
ncbi:MAG: cytochrome-c peroxidase [Gemmatimonadaceae bacterium]